MKRFMSFVCALVLVCTFVCPAAQASGDGQITPRSPSCSNCGGGCSRGYVGRHYDSSQVVGDCKHGTHYYAEGGEAWICDDCGSVEYVQHGHYCTGNGGHYCLGNCSCKN